MKPHWLTRVPPAWRARLMRVGFNLHPAFRATGGRVQYVSPEALSFLISMNLMASLAIGGRGMLLGAVLGGAFYVTMPLAAGAINQSKICLLYGAVLLAVLFFLPNGLASLAPRLGALVKRSAPSWTK